LDVICCRNLFSARPLRAVVDDSPDLSPIGRFLHRRSRKAGLVPRLQFLLLIEPDDDSRVMYAECQHTSRSTLLAVDTTDDGLIPGTGAEVIVNWICVPGSRTPKYEEIYRRVIML
jgi:hypothetical protein